MHLDVVDLRNFYYRTRLGRAAQAAIRARVIEFWGDTKGQTVAGFGFAVPLLRPHLDTARRVIAMMPAEQGVMPWPAGLPNVSVMVQETAWPLETGHVDRLVLMHGLETSENPSALLEECWRVLGPGGRALFIVPNRSGLWARGDTTPFGFGRPYTTGQLEAQLKRHNFIPEGHASALFQPPSHRRFWLRLGPMMEKFGRKTAGSLVGGVHIIEATKRTHAPSRPGLAEAVKRPLGAIEALGKPGTSPARQVPEGGKI